LRLTRRQWRALLEWFVRGMTSAQIAHETQLERKRILRALTVVRLAMLESAPEGVRPSPGGRGPPPQYAHDSESGDRWRGRPRAAVIGLRLAGEFVWADVLPDDDAGPIGSLRDRKNARELHETMAPEYDAAVYRGHLYRLAGGADGQPAAPFGQLEGFWAYLHQRLRSKGGIRRARLGLYLAEYAWRYNHRKLSAREQIRQLMKLISQRRTSARIITIPISASTTMAR